MLVVRGIGVFASLVMVVLVVWSMVRPEDRPTRDEEWLLERVPDQKVEITARDNVRIRVAVDGVEAFTGVVPPGETKLFEGQKRVEVEVPRVDRVRLRYNGRRIVPQGRQDVQRTLVFIDDRGP